MRLLGAGSESILPVVVAVDFEKGIVWIKWIGTHKAYDKIDVTEVRHGS